MMAKISKAYETIPSNICKFSVYFIYGFVAIIIFTISSRKIFNDTSTSEISLNDSSSIIKAITWNIAAINNNPFEYWITNSDPIYNKMMKDVSKYIETPGEYDIAVESIFSQTMYDDLENSMKLAGWKQVDLDETKQLWLNDYKNRKIISEFIKDPIIGKKRLASMPDRVTNTINTIVQGVVTRPTVINCYSGVDLSSINNWFNEWKSFMFDKKIKIFKKGVETELKILDLIQTIKKSKYPTLTEQEERVSLPLQTVCLAIFDSILVNMMNTIGKETWQPLREDMCNKLNRHKNERTIEILETTYADSDIQFLQEVAGSFQQSTVGSKLESKFDIYLPATIDSERDQNSFILLKKGKYKVLKEVTSEVILQFPKDIKIPIVNGDLFVLSVIDVISNDKYLLASFHGDTNGLATIPVVNAVTKYHSILHDHKLLFGMDANTYAKPESDQQGVVKFAQYYKSKDLNSCYGQNPNPLNFTTFHARTHLQPQLNKAVTLEEKDNKGDKNPKDFIIFYNSDFKVLHTNKDNTGNKVYVENMVFPTLSFPSDHGVTSTILKIENNNNEARIKDIETEELDGESLIGARSLNKVNLKGSVNRI